MKIVLCLRCDAVLDAFTSVGPTAVPRVGDFSICAYCGNMAVFTTTGLRQATVAEVELISKTLLADLDAEGPVQ